MDNPAVMPPPAVSGVKRPRTSNANPLPSGPGDTSQAGSSANPRTKRKKVEAVNTESAVDGSATKRARARPNAGKEKEKEKDEEEEEADGEIHTKVDFNDLPDETLYKYLEYHDLLPTFSISPWSDLSPGTQPHKLYSTRQPTPAPEASQSKQPTPLPESSSLAPSLNADDALEDGVAITTRSKTAPIRKQPTPPPSLPAADDVRVSTLSDVAYAREILAEKANGHWIKGLGGGQNRETETIVNFLYKMKVGPGRLLRVYNQNAASYT